MQYTLAPVVLQKDLWNEIAEKSSTGQSCDVIPAHLILTQMTRKNQLDREISRLHSSWEVCQIIIWFRLTFFGRYPFRLYTVIEACY